MAETSTKRTFTDEPEVHFIEKGCSPKRIYIDELEIITYSDNGGATLSRNNKKIFLNQIEWLRFINLESVLLGADDDYFETLNCVLYKPLRANFVSVSEWKDNRYIDLRCWYWGKHHYLPTVDGVKLRFEQYREIVSHFDNLRENE